MRHTGLKVRMLVMGSVLFGFYAALVAFFRPFVGLPIVVVGTLLFVLVQYALGKWLALRSVGAEDLSEDQYPHVHRTVEDLSAEMGLSKPKLKVARMGVPNAFAVGRKGAGVVVVSESILDLLSEDELAGVLAHELAHINNRDVIMMLIGQSIATLLGLTVFWVLALLDDSIIVTIVAWILSAIVQFVVSLFVLAISRYREYVADSDAARYTDDPEAMARALAKIGAIGHHDDAPAVPDDVGALCLFGGKRGLLATITATHPPIEKRIEKLTGVDGERAVETARSELRL